MKITITEVVPDEQGYARMHFTTDTGLKYYIIACKAVSEQELAGALLRLSEYDLSCLSQRLTKAEAITAKLKQFEGKVYEF